MEADLVIHRSQVLPEDETGFNRRPVKLSVGAAAVIDDCQVADLHLPGCTTMGVTGRQ